jgi:hypothetical protein
MRDFFCVREEGPDYSKLDADRTKEERIYLMRGVLFGTLTVTALLYGLAVYYGLSSAQHGAAEKEFKSMAAQMGLDIRKSFSKSSNALSFLAERYATTFPDEAEWPTVYLPGFVQDMHYLRDIANFEVGDLPSYPVPYTPYPVTRTLYPHRPLSSSRSCASRT